MGTPEWFRYSDGTWHHIVKIFDGKNFKLYIDGVLIGESLPIK